MMQVLFGFLMGAAVLFGLCTAEADKVFAALLQGGQEAVKTAFSLAGSFGIFCGLMNILSRSGVLHFLTRFLKKPLRFLLGEGKEKALPHVAMNLAANMLGLGNAATPAGLKAAKLLAEGERAGHALCMFLVINASSVQLIPTTVVALRAAHGAANPEAVILPGLLSTALSTLVGILSCKWMERRR